jgi:hypothetical protein
MFYQHLLYKMDRLIIKCMYMYKVLITRKECWIEIKRTIKKIMIWRSIYRQPVYVGTYLPCCDKSSGDNLIFLGPVFFHWDASYFTFNTFFSHVKARLDSNVQCIDIRIGSDDEGELTKAIDNVFYKGKFWISMYVTFLKHILVSYLRMVNIPRPPEKKINQIQCVAAPLIDFAIFQTFDE